MSGINEWRKRVATSARERTPKQLEGALKRQIASAAGTEYFSNRDPVYHVTETFSRTFDMMAAQKARGAGSLYETWMREMVPGLWPDEPERGENAGATAGGEAAGGGMAAGERGAESRFLEQTSMGSMFDNAPREDERFLNRFSETAFNRGVMAGAVMRGRGQMMLFSCLKRTIGQSQPKNFRQRKLFSASSAQRDIAGRVPDKVYFNRGAVDGAVGIVVDVLRDARRVVDSLSELAGGTNVLKEGSGAETLQKIYPFLSDGKEQALLKSYRREMGLLRGPDDADKRDILGRAIVKTEALIEKKREMKFRFMAQLRQIADSAAAAIAVFSQEEFRRAVFERLGEYSIPEPPPDDKAKKQGAGFEDIESVERDRKERT